MLTGVFAAIAPSADATVLNVASCSGMKGLGTLKSTSIDPVSLKPYGITDTNNKDVSVSVKGVDPTTNKGTSFGSCTYAAGLSTPDGQKPPAKGYNGSKAIFKWSSKLFSPEADCNTLDTTDNTEWPINGAFALQYDAGLNKQSIAVTVDGFTDPDNDPDTPSDVVDGRGLVTKGVAAGADMTFQVYFEPAFKDKLQTGPTPYFGYNFDLGEAVGCTDPENVNGPPPADPGNNNVNANITSVVIGDGTSLLLGLPAPGLAFTIGTP
jgi:hypothetical protein